MMMMMMMMMITARSMSRPKLGLHLIIFLPFLISFTDLLVRLAELIV